MLGKRSVAKRQATATSAATGGGVMDASKKIVTDLEKQLSSFLDESIQLYKYLIERYVRELLPLSQSQSSTADADDDDDDLDSAKEEHQDRFQAIVISLYRMNIHLGDLYRYSASFKLAEECYLLAAQLSPGTGNPYNQLAVVAQQSPDSMTALALYYYARSLMATNEPFETSRTNLGRLFDANHRWITEHKRGNQDTAGIIVDMNHDGMTKKEQKEWMHKQRTAANRMSLARLVDLQWVFYRGVSLESNSYVDNTTDGKTPLDSVIKEMSWLHETLTNLMEHASFSELLLCKLVVILAFSTLGASTGGKSITADQFKAKRANDPKWQERIIMSNQALAFSFFLRFCAMLAKDVDAMISKKEAAGSLHKLGTVRSLPSLLLGFRFVTSIYEGCDWFHGLSYFLSIKSADDVRKTSTNCAIHKLCMESHTEFWSSIAVLANRMDTLPNQSLGTQEETDLANVTDFNDFHGYAPFASFLDKCDTNTISLMRKRRTKKYATVDKAIHALAKTKPVGGNNGGDAATMVKIKIFLSIANGKTCPTSQIDGNDGEQYFLSRVAGSSIRVLATVEDQMSPTFTDEVYAVDMGVDDVHEAIMEQSPPKGQPPSKSSLSGIREGLLTPAALLAANADQPQMKFAVNEKAKELPLSSPFDSLVQWNTNHHAPPVQAPLFPPSGLIPPPGFPFQPQQGSQVPLAPLAGISSVESQTPQQYEQNMGGMISQAGSRFSSSNTLFETLNPFAYQAPHSSFNNDFYGSSFGLNQQRGFDARLPNEGRLDTTLDFFHGSNIMRSTDDLASSEALYGSVPTSAGPEDPGDSILSFLFDLNDSSKAGQQVYSGQPRTMQTGMTRTNNPFAT